MNLDRWRSGDTQLLRAGVGVLGILALLIGIPLQLRPVWMLAAPLALLFALSDGWEEATFYLIATAAVGASFLIRLSANSELPAMSLLAVAAILVLVPTVEDRIGLRYTT